VQAKVRAIVIARNIGPLSLTGRGGIAFLENNTTAIRHPHPSAWYPQLAMATETKTATDAAATAKPPIYLLDSMAFIFRAYHAMQRQRPMSTRTGIPTAATYVFVNMINKLRKDFAPQYLAAVYDVGAPVHRNELAGQFKDVQKFNIKTQAF
jgi:hypothetical protein